MLVQLSTKSSLDVIMFALLFDQNTNFVKYVSGVDSCATEGTREIYADGVNWSPLLLKEIMNAWAERSGALKLPKFCLCVAWNRTRNAFKQFANVKYSRLSITTYDREFMMNLQL